MWLGALIGVRADEEREAARRIERLGFGSLFTGERIGGKEAMAHQAVLLAATDHIVTGTGIANVWARHPAAMQGGADTMGDAYPGRFVLGLGVSHALLVDGSGHDLREAAGPHDPVPDRHGDAAAIGPFPAVPVPRILAALRPADAGAGPRPGRRGPSLLRARPPTRPWPAPPSDQTSSSIPEQAVVLSTDPATARRMARAHMAALPAPAQLREQPAGPGLHRRGRVRRWQ